MKALRAAWPTRPSMVKTTASGVAKVMVRSQARWKNRTFASFSLAALLGTEGGSPAHRPTPVASRRYQLTCRTPAEGPLAAV